MHCVSPSVHTPYLYLTGAPAHVHRTALWCAMLAWPSMCQHVACQLGGTEGPLRAVTNARHGWVGGHQSTGQGNESRSDGSSCMERKSWKELARPRGGAAGVRLARQLLVYRVTAEVTADGLAGSCAPGRCYTWGCGANLPTMRLPCCCRPASDLLAHALKLVLVQFKGPANPWMQEGMVGGEVLQLQACQGAARQPLHLHSRPSCPRLPSPACACRRPQPPVPSPAQACLPHMPPHQCSSVWRMTGLTEASSQRLLDLRAGGGGGWGGCRPVWPRMRRGI